MVAETISHSRLMTKYSKASLATRFSRRYADIEYQDDVMAAGQRCRHCWPFVRGIHRSSVDSPHKGPANRSFDNLLLPSWTSWWTNSPNGDDFSRHDTHVTLWWNLATYSIFHKICTWFLILCCFLVVMLSFLVDFCGMFIHIFQGCFPGTGAIVWLPQSQGSYPGKLWIISTSIKPHQRPTNYEPCGEFLACIPA